MKDNPNHYRIEGNAVERNVDEQLHRICERDITSLRQIDLITEGPMLESTAFGSAMAKYQIGFETMKILLALPPKAKPSAIVGSMTTINIYS